MERKDWRGEIANFMHYFGLFMIITYIGLGVFVLYYEGLKDAEQSTRVIISFFFFAYAAFRAVRWIQKNKSRKYGNYSNDDEIL